jgi:hypothetical protein
MVSLLALSCSSTHDPDADFQESEQSIAAGVYNFATLTTSGKCIDINGAGTADGTNIQQWTCNGTAAQAFRVEDLGGGSARLVNPSSGKCMDVSGNGTADGTNIQLWTCNGTGAQSFRIVDGANGNVTIRNTNSNKCVDVNRSGTTDGTNIHLWTCNGTNAQNFRPALVGQPPVVTDPTTRALCSDKTPYSQCQATDFSKENIVGNSKWDITTWGNANRRHSVDNVWVQDGMLVMKVNGGTPKGQTTVGAEIISKKRNFLYGSFRTMAKTAREPGTVNSPLFYYLSDTSEIDVEILSQENPRHLVNYTIHQNNRGALTYNLFNAGFDPSADFHEYRFDWSPQGVQYYIDGKPTVLLTGNTPYQPGAIMVNHWTLSDPGWGGGPPIGDAFMYVKYFEFYFN